MSDSDKMRQEFEQWAKLAAYDLSQTTDDKYWCVATISAWQVWQAAYQAARNAAQREAEEWSKSVNKSYIETANKPEGER